MYLCEECRTEFEIPLKYFTFPNIEYGCPSCNSRKLKDSKYALTGKELDRYYEAWMEVRDTTFNLCEVKSYLHDIEDFDVVGDGVYSFKGREMYHEAFNANLGAMKTLAETVLELGQGAVDALDPENWIY